MIGNTDDGTLRLLTTYTKYQIIQHNCITMDVLKAIKDTWSVTCKYSLVTGPSFAFLFVFFVGPLFSSDKEFVHKVHVIL